MAKQRYINTKIWEDGWFSSLDQIEQLVFIYFLTNPMTNIIGAYELSKATISRAVGLEVMTLDEILSRFAKAGKVYYVDGWVVLPNFIKHQNYKSPQIQKGMQNELEGLPEPVKKHLKLDRYGIDTLSHLNSIKSNLIKSNLVASDDARTPAEITRDYFEDSEMFTSLVNEIADKIAPDRRAQFVAAAKKQVPRFISYWTEPTRSGKRERWETEKTFEVKRRFMKWLDMAARDGPRSNQVRGKPIISLESLKNEGI